MIERILAFLGIVPQASRAVRDVAVATGRPVSEVAAMAPNEVLDAIVAAGIRLADVPEHVWRELGLIPLRR
ncbi:MAG: hypothetical protein ACPGID_02165 [Rubricella sp.]